MMNHSETITDLAAALAKAQGALVNPGRNREVTVKSERGSYKFKYATLDAILDAVRKPLADNGLAFTQALGAADGKLALVTLLTHTSGQWLRCEMPVTVEGPGMQRLGSAQTYARRYAISSLLGIAADEDDDANSADGNTIIDQKDRTPANKAKANGDGTEPAHAAWVRKAIEQINAAETRVEIEAWQKKNQAAMDRLGEKAPDERDQLASMLRGRWTALGDGSTILAAG